MNIFSELRTSRSARISLTIIIAVAAYYGLLTYITPWTQDDMTYQFNFASDEAGNPYDRIDSIGEIFESQATHYLTVNGRFVAHFLVQLFCGLLGKGLFSVFNAFFYIVFVQMILKLSNTSVRNIGATLTAIIITIISFQTKLTPSCQISYIWMYTIIMVFIWLLFHFVHKQSLFTFISLGFLSLIAGNAHESLSIGVSAALIVYWLKNWKRMNASQYVMMVCFGFGAVCAYLSPGTIQRALDTPNPSTLLYFGKMIFAFVKFSSALYVLFAIVCWQFFKKKKTWREIYRVGPFYWNVLIVLLIFNFCISIHGNRQLFGIELMAVVLSIQLLKKHSFTRTWLCLFGTLACVCITAITEFTWRYSDYFDEIVRQYPDSPTGEVFVDLNEQSILNQQRFPVSSFCYYNLLPNTDHNNIELNDEDRCFERFFRTAYPGHPTIKILPKVLEGNRHRRLPNQVIKLSPELAVVIQDKAIASDIIIKRSVDIPGFHKVLPDENISNPERYAVDADYWRAYIYDLSPFATYGRVTKREIQIVPQAK